MIVLTILKWIGIVLLWLVLGLLALALLILLVVLFVPVRYRVGVASPSPDGGRINYQYHITWILHAISIRKKPDSAVTVVRLFGIPIKKIGGEPDIRPGEGHPGADAEDEDIDESLFDDEDFDEDIRMTETVAEESSEEDAPETEAEGPPEEPVGEAEEAEETTAETEGPEEEPEDVPDENEEPEIEPDQAREKEEKEPLDKRIEGLKDKFRKKFKKLDFLFYKISSIISFVKGRATRRTIRRLLREVVKAIRHVGPRKISGHLEFGTGDPGSTGMILGGVSLCKLAYRKDISIVPNFEEKCLTGDAYVRGRIRTVFFVRMALRIWFDKDVHALWKQYRRMRKDFRKREKQLAES